MQDRGERKTSPFDLIADYQLYVDGKPRLDGVCTFLTSRGIQLPKGRQDDAPQDETLRGVGNRKNDLINKVIENIGVERYEGSVRAIHSSVIESSNSPSSPRVSTLWPKRSAQRSPF